MLARNDAAMNVLMLSDVYFPRVNGVSTSIRTCARNLQARGHAVTLVAPDYPQRADAEPFEVIRIAARTIFFDPEDRLMRERALRQAQRDLSHRHWDVVHVHTPFHAHRIGTRLARETGVPVVESYHTYFEQYVSHYLPWLPGGALRFTARGLSRRLCNAVDHLIVPSEQMVDVLGRYGIEVPNTVLPTGIDLKTFAGGDGDRFRHKHGIGLERPVIVTVSRLAREKNIEFLLRVVATLVTEFPQLLFLIAGEGPDAPRLRALAHSLGLRDHVLFFGNLDRETELLDCYRAADAFVFASPTETQGLVLIEAMALGVPIVSTAVMGTASVLRDAKGARVAPESVPAFANHVAEVLRSPQLRADLSAAARVDARAWSVDALMDRVERLYESLARSRA